MTAQTTLRRLTAKLGLTEGQLASLDDLSTVELGFIDGIIAGAAQASKALVLDSSKGISTITSATITTLTSTTVNVSGVGTFGTVAATAINVPSIVKQSATLSFTSGDTGATLTNLTGLVQTVVPGTYKFKVFLPGVATANSGMKVGFKLTTTVLTSIEATGKAATASALVVQHTTTATDQASLVASTTAALLAEVEGTMVVGTGGTIQVQGAQNASHGDTTSFYLGGYFELVRIA